MQLLQIISLSLFGLSTSASIIKRDFATFQTAFTAVGNALTAFDQSVLALTPTSDVPTAVSDLTTKSNAIVDALNTGATNINATEPLGLTDSVNLLSLSNTLVTTANTTINDLISKKPIIDAAGQDALVITQLQAVKAASYSFIGAVTTHVPSSVSSIAAQQAGQVITIINNGLAAYGGPTTRRLLALML